MQVTAGLVGGEQTPGNRTYANVASAMPGESHQVSRENHMTPANQSHHTEEDDDTPPSAQAVNS